MVSGMAPIAIDVAPKTTRPYSIMLQRNSTAGTREMINLQLESAQLPAPLKGTAEVQTAYVAPNAPDTLSVDLPRSGLISLFEATPMQELHFKDANDLSATLQMQKTAEGVRVRVNVTDQTHFTVADPQLWWQGDSIQWAIGLPNGQMWEWMGTLLPTGPQMNLSLAPDGKSGTPYPITIRRQDTQTIYEWILPRTIPNGTPLPERFNFNFIVNDNDGIRRKGWIEWTPGIGMEKNPASYMPIAIQ
jgi:hypothetical protein